MKSMGVVVVLIALCLALGVGIAQAFTFNDGSSTYVTGPYMGMYQGNRQWPLSVDGGAAQGLLMFDAAWRSFKVLGFENAGYWGWTLEGHWAGSGSPAFGVVNNGTHFDTTLTFGAAPRTSSGGGLYKK